MDLKRLSDLINKRGADSDSTTKSKKTKLNSKNATELPNVRVSSNRSPIYTDNPKDPRIKAYQDSLVSYEQGKRIASDLGKVFDEKYSSRGGKPEYSPFLSKNYEAGKMRYALSGNDGKIFGGDKPVISKTDLKNTIDYYENSYGEGGRKIAEQLKKYANIKTKPYRTLVNAELPPVQVYKRPVQPVVYKKTEQVKANDSKKDGEVIQQDKKLEAPTLREYSGNPIYANTPYSMGAGALIGFESKGNITYIAPEDYERFGVPSYAKKIIESKSKNK